MRTISTALLWLLTRAFVLWLLFYPHHWVTGDIAYFDVSLRSLAEGGLGSTLVEYPLPGVALVAFPWLLAQWVDRPDAYSDIVMGLALVTDALFMVLLKRCADGRRAPVVAWLLAVPLLGATTYARFDLVPGVLTGAAVLLLSSHPRVAAGAGAVATGLKLWPALVLPALAAPRGSRRPVLGIVLGTGVVLIVASIVVTGWDRLVSPLTWQAERGLQVEAVLATPAMLAWALEWSGHVVAYSEHNAFEVSGTGVPALLDASSVLSALLVPGLVLLWARAWRHGRGLGPDAVVWLSLAAVTAFMATSKVLSPQYLLWLLPMAAAGLAVVETDRGRHQLRRWVAVLLVATGTTHLVFPVFYGGLVGDEPSLGVILLLAARNLMLVWLLVQALVETWHHTRTRTAAA